MTRLDEKGFVFLDDNNRPFLCRMYHGKPWLFYWHRREKHWVTLRIVNQSDIWSFPHNLTNERQQYYHDAHEKWVREHAPVFKDETSTHE